MHTITSRHHLPLRAIRTAAVAGAAALLLLAACTSSADSAPTTTRGTIVPSPAVDAVTHLTVHGEAGDTIEPFEAEEYDHCTRRTAIVHRADADVQVTVWDTGCPTQVPMNGRHGTYASLDDPAVPSDATALTLPIGDALAFTQLYTVYTNSATEYHEPVVLIALRDPVGSQHRMAMVVGANGEADPAEVAAVAEALSITT